MLRRLFARNPSASVCCHHRHSSCFSQSSVFFCYRHASKTINELPPSNLRAALNKPLADFISEDFSQSEKANLTTILPERHSRVSVRDYIVSRRDSSLIELNSLLGEKLWRLLPDLITMESSQKLLPGQVQRHTAVLPYGIVARKAALVEANEGIRKIERNDESNISKEKTPLILVVGITRQGKTAFLDNVANNFDGVLNVCGHVFCVNITFNSTWGLEYRDEFRFENVGHAFEQFAIRSIAAAADANKITEITSKIIVPIVELARPTSAQLSDLLRSRLKQLHGVDPFLVFLADEITNFDRYLPNDDVKVAFSSEINNLIAFRSAVIQSGFTTSTEAITMSGRRCHHCVLHPLSSPELRRQSSAMSTMFFQQVAASITLVSAPQYSTKDDVPASIPTDVRRRLKDSYFYFELIKSSAGSLGVMLEDLVQFTVTNLKNPMAHTPVLASHCAERRIMINTCLAWKSIQFCSYNVIQTTYFSNSITHEAFFAMCDAILDAGSCKQVYLPTSRLRWKTYENTAAAHQHPLDDDVRREPTENALRRIENARKRSQLDGRSSTSLSQISIEPIYVFFSKDNDNNEIVGEYFRQFADMLMNYSTAMHALPYVTSFSATEFGDVFAEELTQCHVKCCNGALPLLRRIVGNRFLTHAPRCEEVSTIDGIEIHTDAQGRDTSITAYFFEDAIAVGISAQKSLRASLYQNRAKTDVTKLDASVDDFLENSRIFPAYQDRENAPIVRWIDKEIQNRTATKCFTGSFPRPSASHSSSVSIHDFNRHTILHPERPENNALVDIIFHERIAGDETNKEGLIQFWVDAKHRHARHSSSRQTPERFADLVAEALENPLLQAKSSQAGKRIIHSVVHVIVSPKKADSSHLTAIPNALKKRLSALSAEKDLPDYYFYVVDPDSVAFENLVSQPIARAMPLMDQQCLNSWRQRCSLHPSDWAKYKSTLQHHGLEHVIQNTTEFCEWRQLRLLDDSVSTLRSCFRGTKESDNFIRALVECHNNSAMKAEVDESIKNNSNSNSPNARTVLALGLLSFGAILEKVGVLCNDAHRHDRRLTFLGSKSLSVIVLADEQVEQSKRESRMILTWTDNSFSPFVLNLDSNEFRKFMNEKITIGHLIDGHHGEFGYENAWNVLFDKAFLTELKLFLEKVKDQLQPILDDRLVHWVDREFWEHNPSLIGTMLFNLPFKTWQDSSAMFDISNASWNEKNQTLRRQILHSNSSGGNHHEQDLWADDEPLILDTCWDSCFYVRTDDSPQQLFNHRNSELCFILKMMQLKYKSLDHDPSPSTMHRSNFIKFMSVLDHQVEKFLLKVQQPKQYNSNNNDNNFGALTQQKNRERKSGTSNESYRPKRNKSKVNGKPK